MTQVFYCTFNTGRVVTKNGNLLIIPFQSWGPLAAVDSVLWGAK